MLALAHALAAAPQGLPDAIHQDPQLAILTGLCVVLSGIFHISSVGRERARHRLVTLLGAPGTSLAPLRRAMEAKARGQASAVYLVIGGLAYSGSYLVKVEFGPAFTWICAGVLVAGGVGFLLALEGYVSNAMRRLLQSYLRQHPFPFEDHIALTREIGELFGVTSTPEDTLDDYLARLRVALDIDEPPSPLFRARVPSLHT